MNPKQSPHPRSLNGTCGSGHFSPDHDKIMHTAEICRMTAFIVGRPLPEGQPPKTRHAAKIADQCRIARLPAE
jgi:hypothetical protein